MSAADTIKDLPASAPVVIIGGSMVGLSMAAFLGYHGIEAVVIEKHESNNPLPRAAHFHVRTIEYFRQLGIEQSLIEESRKHYSKTAGMNAVKDLASGEIAVWDEDITKGVAEISPCLRLFVAQKSLEPVVRGYLEKSTKAKLFFSTKVESVQQDVHGCTVTVSSGGESKQIRTPYIVACDGVKGKTRESLGVRFEGYGILSSSITIYFRADMTQIPGAKEMIHKNGVIYVNHPELQGFFRCDKDAQGGFLAVMLSGSGSEASTYIPANFDKTMAHDWVRLALGSNTTVPIEVTMLAPWNSQADYVERARSGRIFLVGDAAHAVPPTGGFGGNLGIDDAHALSWKLAYVLNGLAHPDLLRTHDEERLPAIKFTVEQAYARYCDRFIGVERPKETVVDDLRIEVGYAYETSKAIVRHAGFPYAPYGTSIPTEDVRMPSAGPGFRAPHVWLRKGHERLSTLDLFGQNFVLLTEEQSAWRWDAVASHASKNLGGLTIKVHGIGRHTPISDPNGLFITKYKISAGEAVLVRPDGVIGARLDGNGTEYRLERIVAAILGLETLSPDQTPAVARPPPPPPPSSIEPLLERPVAKIAVIYTSLYGHIKGLAEEVARGAGTTGADVKILQFPQVLSDEVLAKMGAAPAADYPIVTPDDLKTFDGILFGLPTRFGRAPAAASSFFDATGSLWATGALVGKCAGVFTGAASQHGGIETTVLTTIPFFAHHGMAYVPMGFTHPNTQDNSEIVGGSAYGAAAISSADGSRAVSKKELAIASHQGQAFAKFVSAYVRGQADM